MKRKPRPHDGIVTIDLEKNRLVEIPLIGSEPPDDGLTADSVNISNAAITSEKITTCACM